MRRYSAGSGSQFSTNLTAREFFRLNEKFKLRRVYISVNDFYFTLHGGTVMSYETHGSGERFPR